MRSLVSDWRPPSKGYAVVWRNPAEVVEDPQLAEPPTAETSPRVEESLKAEVPLKAENLLEVEEPPKGEPRLAAATAPETYQSPIKPHVDTDADAEGPAEVAESARPSPFDFGDFDVPANERSPAPRGNGDFGSDIAHASRSAEKRVI